MTRIIVPRPHISFPHPALVVGSGSVASPTGGYNYFIGPSGSDSNSGLSELAPWSINALNTKRATYAGKSIGFLPGTYDISAANAPRRAFAIPLFNIAGGSPGSPTLLKSVTPRGAWIYAKTAEGVYTGEKSIPPAFFNGISQPHEGGIFANTTGVTLGNVIIDGFKMSGERATLIRVGEGPATNNYSIAGIIIRNNELFDCDNRASQTADGSNASAIQLFNCDGALVRNNYIHDNFSYNTNTTDHLSAIIVWTCRGTIIEYNSIVAASAIYGKRARSYNTICRFNYVREARSGGGILDFAGGNPADVGTSEFHHNIMHTGSTGLTLTSTDGVSVGYNTPVHVYNNTIVVTAVGINQSHFSVFAEDDAVGAVQYYNNATLGSASPDRKMISSNALAYSINGYNCYPGSGALWRLMSNTTPNLDSGADYNNINTYRAAVAAAGGLSAALMEQGSIQSSQTLAQLFELSGSLAAQYIPKAGTSALLNNGKVSGTSIGATCNIGAWDGFVTQIGHDHST